MKRAGAFTALVLAAASLAAAKEKPKAKGAAPAAPPKPVVTVIGIGVTGAALGAENDEVRPFSNTTATELTLAVTVTPPAGIVALSGDPESLQIDAGGALESPEFGWSPTLSPDGSTAIIDVRAAALPAGAASTISATGTLKAVVSPGAVTEKLANVTLATNGTLRLGGATVTVTEVQADDDTVKATFKGPSAVLEAVKAIRFRAGGAAAVAGETWGSGSNGEGEAERTYRFAAKGTSGALEVDLWQAPREMAVPFRVSAGLGLPAPPSSAGTIARSRIPPLPLGTATGELMLDGKVIKLAHAAAVSGPDDFDETKEAYTVYLTEKPIAAGVLEKAADLKSADPEVNGLVMTVRPEEKYQSYRLLLRHPSTTKSLQQSSMLSGRERWAPLGPDRVDGLVKSFHDDRPDEMLGHQVQYKVRFNAPLRKRFAVEAPLVLAAGATKLPAGGGAVGKAYLDSQCGPLPVDPEDPKAVEAFLAKEGKLPTEADLAQMSKEAGKPVTREDAIKLFSGLIGLASAFRPADCKVLGGSQDAALAILQIEATMMGDRSVADAYMVKDGSGWSFKKHGTWRSAPKK
jgi:hypothetical protein